ncbi:putative T6SS immunity periplasmic lipoprotein [Kluyvera chengduensis]|uniref:putative T6SS immunity periplasmic lipoprotein n=1 Tax=Kluyvera sp. 142359 TaxID=3375726 RepID=UPI0037737175
MKHYFLIPALFALAGCGAGDSVPPWRSFPIINNSLCFSVNKSDVLSRYGVYSEQGNEYKTLAENSHVALSYPETCLKIPITPGYIYAASYTLNGTNYRYNFFIDRNGQILSTKEGDL